MILDSFSLKGKVAIVTGSNTGLGQGICRAYAEAGAKVVGVSRRPSTETEELIGSENFYNAIADLSSCEVIPELRQNRYPRQQRGHNQEAGFHRVLRRELGQRFKRKFKDRFLFDAGGCKTVHKAGRRRQDYKHRLNALLSGRHKSALVHGKQVGD